MQGASHAVSLGDDRVFAPGIDNPHTDLVRNIHIRCDLDVVARIRVLNLLA